MSWLCRCYTDPDPFYTPQAVTGPGDDGGTGATDLDDWNPADTDGRQP